MNRWWTFIGASLMVFLVNVDSTVVNLALATIAKELHTNLPQIQWIIISYLLTTTIFFIIGGKLADILGLRKIFLTGTLLFAIASLIAGLANNFILLIAARLLQGIGFAFTLSLALLMISNVFASQQRGFVLGLAVMIASLGQTLGPTLGGVILEIFDWRWIFLINVPIAILSFLIILIFGSTHEPYRKEHSIDIKGSVLFAIALTILLLTFNLLTVQHFNLHWFAFGLIISLIVFLLFYWREIKTIYPLIDFKLFARRDFTLSICIRFLYLYIFGNVLFFIPLYLQNILGYTPLIAGLVMLVYSSLFGICSPMAGLWTDHAGYKRPIIFASLISLIAFIVLGTITPQTHLPWVLLGLITFGMSAGIMIPSTINSTISSLPKISAGEGIGIMFTIAFIGMSLGVAIGGVQVSMITANDLLIHGRDMMTALDAADLDTLHRVANATQPIDVLKNIFTSNQYPLISLVAKESFITALSSVMWVNALFSAIIFILSIAFKEQVTKTTTEELEEMV